MSGIELFERDRRQVLQDYAQRPVLDRLPATFWETTALAFSADRESVGIGAQAKYFERWEKAVTVLEERTGRRWANPYEMEPRSRAREVAEAEARDALRALRLDDPSLPDPDTFAAEIGEDLRDLRQRREAAAGSAGFGGQVGDVLGSMAAIMTHPLVLGSMAVGAPVAAGFLRTALIEAGVAGTSEALVQMGAAPFRQEVGLEGAVDEAARSVLLATAGGAVLAPAFKALGMGARRLFGRGGEVPLEVRDAARQVWVKERLDDELAELRGGGRVAPETASALHRELLPEVLAAVRRGEIPDVERLARERGELGRAYDAVRGAPAGPADDPLVRLTPADIEATIVARGGFKGIGDVEVKGSGWGLVKIIWRHGEASGKPSGKQVTRDDILRLPEIMRTRQATAVGEQREWIVERGDGERLVYVDSPVADRAERRVITIHVLDDPASREPSPPLAPVGASGASGSPGRAVAGPAGDTTPPPFAQQAEGRTAPGADAARASPEDMAPGAVPVNAHRFAREADAARRAADTTPPPEDLADDVFAELMRRVEAEDLEVVVADGGEPVSAARALREAEAEEHAMLEGPVACLLSGAADAVA